MGPKCDVEGILTQLGVLTKVPESQCKRKTVNGDKISVHYEGSLDDGTVFDSSFKRGQPIDFTLGAGQVIKGWDQGLTRMCIGEKRKLTIPSDLAYGDRGAGNVVPPKATLTFIAELVAIQGYTPEVEEVEEVENDEF